MLLFGCVGWVDFGFLLVLGCWFDCDLFAWVVCLGFCLCCCLCGCLFAGIATFSLFVLAGLLFVVD